MDFTQSMDNGYMIPTSVAVGSGEATDIRCVCDTVEDFKKVIDSKSKEWLNTDFEKYLRPATLFGTKFENYLNEANKKTPIAVGAENKNIKLNPSICDLTRKYSRGAEIL